jgi:DNA-binding transcriptional ArsR family regulator
MKPTHELLTRIAERLKALADPTRLKILHSLEEGERTVTEILAEVGGSQANVSKHLGLMRRVGILEARREGVNVYYRVIDPAAFAVCRSVCDALEQRADSERRLLKRAVASARRIQP